MDPSQNIILVDGCHTATSLLFPELHVDGMRLQAQSWGAGGTVIALAGKDKRMADGNGMQARGGGGQRNSVFAASLLKHLRKTGTTLSQLLLHVRQDVNKATNMMQQPQVKTYNTEIIWRKRISLL